MIDEVSNWAAGCEDIFSLALVGSRPRHGAIGIGHPSTLGECSSRHSNIRAKPIRARFIDIDWPLRPMPNRPTD